MEWATIDSWLDTFVFFAVVAVGLTWAYRLLRSWSREKIVSRCYVVTIPHDGHEWSIEGSGGKKYYWCDGRRP